MIVKMEMKEDFKKDHLSKNLQFFLNNVFLIFILIKIANFWV